MIGFEFDLNRVRVFLEERDANLKPPLPTDLTMLLSMPLNQIPSYEFPLRAILDHISLDHPKYKGLTEALAIVQETSKYIGNALAQADNRSKIRVVQSRLAGKLVKQANQLIENALYRRDGTSSLVTTKQQMPVHLDLFNNALLVSQLKKSTNSQTVLYVYELRNTRIEEKDGFGLEIYMIPSNASEDTSEMIDRIRLTFNNYMDMKDWSRELETHISINQPNRSAFAEFFAF